MFTNPRVESPEKNTPCPVTSVVLFCVHTMSDFLIMFKFSSIIKHFIFNRVDSATFMCHYLACSYKIWALKITFSLPFAFNIATGVGASWRGLCSRIPTCQFFAFKSLCLHLPHGLLVDRRQNCAISVLWLLYFRMLRHPFRINPNK
jgi:hypothetical protein